MIIYLAITWLVAEFVYAVAQRIFLGKPATGRFGWAKRFFFEPLNDTIIERREPAFLVRDVAHASTASIYRAGSTVRLEIAPTNTYPPGLIEIRPVLRRVTSDGITHRPLIQSVEAFDPIALDGSSSEITLHLASHLETGMYRLEFANALHQDIAISLFVNGSDAVVHKTGVVIPTFTIWGYDEKSGWYPGHTRPLLDRCVHRLAKLGAAGWLCAFAIRVLCSRCGIHLNQTSWPVHHSIDLNGFYHTNHRWSKWLWNTELAGFDGVWNDDIDILIPFFALSDGFGHRYRIFSDLDMHRRRPELLSTNHLVFVGQESLTEAFWNHLERFSSDGGRITLWSPQGFGYRQVDYDETTGILKYVCSRGRRGFWNEPLEPIDPPWNESEILGFAFPSPDSARATNPHKVQFDTLDVIEDLPGGIEAGTCFTTNIWDGSRWHPGLNWMGGEPFCRLSPEARVLVAFRGAPDVIGLGTFRNVVVVSPTFLGALWAYGLIERKIVESIFDFAMKRMETKTAERELALTHV